jgi:Fic family protein
MTDSLSWPSHATAVVPWRQKMRGGSREDRMLADVEVRLPPHIAAAQVAVPAAIVTEMEAAIREVSALDTAHGDHLDSLATLLLRTESVASSKIERIEASVEDYARALHGIKSNDSAISMVASTRALADLIDTVTDGADLERGAILRAHRRLMIEDPIERSYAGRFRDMQNWIGGSDHSPRNAVYVPPPPETVEGYVDDLVAFANRTDVPVLVQAAIVHAQFESIHPFTDGNGRIGRALINTVLRRRGATTRVVVPLASALVARRQDYFDVLGDYRDGDAGPIVRGFSKASGIAAGEARVSATRIAEMPQEWRDRVRARRGSAASRLLDDLPLRPIFSAEEAEENIGGATSSVYAAIDRLHEAEIIRPLTNRTRDQVWGAADLLDEVKDLGDRIGARASERG